MSGGRVPVPGLDFTAIDFETANGFRGSPCAVGAVRVRVGPGGHPELTPPASVPA